jgi:hypothetical protein
MSNQDYSRDPDDLHGDEKVEVIEIAIRRNGAMSVAGHINNLVRALAMLDQAKDTLRAHHMRVAAGQVIITPPQDTPLADVKLEVPT